MLKQQESQPQDGQNTGDSKAEQQAIKQWFNRTYLTKGERYLRPVKAYQIFLELLRVKPNHKLLDVACGLGRLIEASQEYGCKAYGVDLSDVAIEKARQKFPKAQLQVANAENLPFNESQFDYVTCLGSLERMLNLEQVLSELWRVGHEQTQYCFLVRNSNTFIWQFFKEKLGMRNKTGHQNAMSLEHWSDTLNQAGYEVISVHHDQYPLQKRKKWFSLGLANVDYKKLIQPKAPLHGANEFIFILKKKLVAAQTMEKINAST